MTFVGLDILSGWNFCWVDTFMDWDFYGLELLWVETFVGLKLLSPFVGVDRRQGC